VQNSCSTNTTLAPSFTYLLFPNRRDAEIINILVQGEIALELRSSEILHPVNEAQISNLRVSAANKGKNEEENESMDFTTFK
jgi:hypothetical protein